MFFDKQTLFSRYYFLMIVVILIATILRFYHFSLIPFHYDEVSSLVRTNYSSFWEMIQKGVFPDGHPFLIQTFLYFWVKIVGYDQFWVKIPFVLMSLLTIWATFRILAFWDFPKSGVIVAVSLAFLQVSLYHSVQIRMYVPGLFMVIFATYFLLLYHQNPNFYYYIGVIIFTFGGIHSHYFSFLYLIFLYFFYFSAFIITKRKIQSLAIFVLIQFVLFIPFLPIFIHQLFYLKGIGGWLASPTKDWLWQYWKYIFHFDNLLIFISISSFLCSFYFAVRKRNCTYFIALLLFALSFLTGFLYSRWVSPVLQFSVMFFTLPALLFVIFYFVEFLKFQYFLTFLTFYTSLGIYSLIFKREHFDTITHHGHHQLLQIYSLNPNKNIHFVADVDPEITSFLAKIQFNNQNFDFNSKSNFEFISQKNQNFYDFDAKLEALKVDTLWYFHYGIENFAILKMIQNHFPFCYQQIQTHNFSAFQLGKMQNANSTRLNPKHTFFVQNHDISNSEFSSLALSIPLGHLNLKGNEQFLIKAEYDSDFEIFLVFSLYQNEELVFYRDTQTPNQSFSVSMYDFHKKKNMSLKVFLWNPRKLFYTYRNLCLEIYDGNLRQYELFQSF